MPYRSTPWVSNFRWNFLASNEQENAIPDYPQQWKWANPTPPECVIMDSPAICPLKFTHLELNRSVSVAAPGWNSILYGISPGLQYKSDLLTFEAGLKVHFLNQMATHMSQASLLLQVHSGWIATQNHETLLNRDSRMDYIAAQNHLEFMLGLKFSCDVFMAKHTPVVLLDVFSIF